MNNNHVTAPRAKVLTSVGAMLMAASALVGCSANTSPTSPAPEAEAPLTVTIEGADDLAGLDARTIIDSLDSTPIADRPTDFTAQVRPDALVITDDSGETELPMPEDQVYVAIAPYEQQTHDCYFHAPVNCIGEQSDTDFEVTVTDSETGDEYVDQSIRTFDNGFIGMWLPRGVTAEVVIEKDGRTATGTVSTVNDDDATCITTMQLT